MTQIYHNRQTIRLKNYDYSQGIFFITICTKNREEILAKIKIQRRGRVPSLPTYDIKQNEINVIYTSIGKLIENTIKYINKMENVKIKHFVIIPDHVHMIIELNMCMTEGRGGTLPLHAVIGRFKSYTTKQYNILNNVVGKKLWQRNYYEHIIRHEKEYYQMCEYIKNNPINYLRKQFLS